MKYLTRFLGMIFLIFLVVGCEEQSNPSYSISEIVESIEIEYQEGDHQDHVTGNMVFPLESPLDSKIKISWISDQPSIIDYFGTVNRPDEDTFVNVTYTVDHYGSEFSQVLTFKVIKEVDDVEDIPSTYTVNYYYQNINDDEYTLEETVLMDAYVDDLVFINPIDVEGFTVNNEESVTTGRVIEENPLILSVFYDRNLYEIILKDGEEIINTLDVKYNQTIDVEDPVKDGYDFVEWRKQGTVVAYDFSNPTTESFTLIPIFKEQDDPYTYTGYYQGAEGLYEDDLESFLHSLLNTSFSGVDYGEARYILNITDQDPNNANNLILVYLGTSISGDWDFGATWNREHVWPQSLLGVSADNDTINSASDLQNLKPSDPQENSSRSNKFYGNTTTAQTYAPRDEVKGDLARILFYMDMMYAELSLIYANEGNTYEMGNLEVLLDWHEQDPVDDFEMRRNNLIQTYQGNRNPFIDHPEFVDKIYNNSLTQTAFSNTYGTILNMIIDSNRV